MHKALLAGVSLALSISPCAQAAEHWTRLVTPHFEMYTTNSPKQGASALNVFEQVRYFFLQNSHGKTAPDTPVRIIAFRSDKEFKPYRTNEGTFAYYLRSRKVDYIVMQDLSPEHHQAAIHEYTHLVVEHLGLKLPVWLNEGLAELYSSLEPRGDQALIGRPSESSVGVLTDQRWLDLNTLFAVTPDSPYYNERDKMSIFYAESWALTHMLDLGKNYHTEFPRFLTAVASGRPVAECLQSVYGKNLAQVTEDLHAYFGQRTVQGGLFDVKLSKYDGEPEVSEPSPFDVDLALADLLASQRNTLTAASARLSQLAQEHPDSPEVQVSLGYLAWQEGDQAKAQERFKLAFDKGSKDPEMLFNYANLLHTTGAPADQTISVLRRAVTLKPDYQDAWFNLGLTAMNARQIEVALDAFSHITKVNEQRAFTLFFAKAYCESELGAKDQARQFALRARQYAKTPDQELQISHLLGYLAPAVQTHDSPGSQVLSSATVPLTPNPAPDRPTLQRSPDLQHVDAVAKFFECGKSPRLHVLVHSVEKVFLLENPDTILVRNGKNGTFDMPCGAQKPLSIGISYLPSSGRPGIDGVVRELVF